MIFSTFAKLRKVTISCVMNACPSILRLSVHFLSVRPFPSVCLSTFRLSACPLSARLSVCLSVLMEQLATHLTDVHEI